MQNVKMTDQVARHMKIQDKNAGHEMLHILVMGDCYYCYYYSMADANRIHKKTLGPQRTKPTQHATPNYIVTK